MKKKVIIYYPWAGVVNDEFIIEIDNKTPESEIDTICFESVLDTIFNRGISWDYKDYEGE